MLREVTLSKIPSEIKTHHLIIRKAVYNAIEKAERFKTTLIVGEKGKVKEISPAVLRRRLAK